MKHWLYILPAVLLTAASCLKETPEAPPGPARVLFVYAGVDNDLAGREYDKIRGLRAGWGGRADDRIIAYVDKKDEGAMLYELSVPESDAPNVLAIYGDENSASGVTLARAIDFVTARYPADSYGLLVFSHASGWLPEGALNDPYAFGDASTRKGNDRDAGTGGGLHGAGPVTADCGTDADADGPGRNGTGMNTSGTRSVITDGTNEMDLREFAAAIPAGVFDYIVFETCFMAGVEAAWELRHKTPYIFASPAEIVDPGFAPVYPASTSKLLAGDLAAFGQSVFDHTLTYSESGFQRSATYSVINTGELEKLALFVRDNCDFTKTVAAADVQRFDRFKGYGLFFDFEDYYSRLLDSDTQRSELSRLVSACVEWKAATETFMTQSAGCNGFAIEKFSGLTAYIPQSGFPGLNARYETLGWSVATARQQGPAQHEPQVPR